MAGSLAPPSFDYDAFISYRRGDGAWYARTLRQRLQNVRVPPDVRSASPDQKLRIYLDQIYERATDDFFEDTIKPALAASRHLVVVKTPSAMNALPDGRASWLGREIEYFCALPPAGRSISVAIASGDLTGALPGRLDESHPNVERLDLRRWRWYRAPGVDDQLLNLAATLHEIRPSDMPALRQEDARRLAAQKRTRRLFVGTALALILAASSAAVWQYLRVREESHRRDIAVASSLWNRLNFSNPKRIGADDLNALWAVRLANAGIRDAFITELLNAGDRGSRLGRRPAPIMRAIYLQWPEEQATKVFDSIVRATTTREEVEHESLWQASEAVARVLPAGSVRAAVASVLTATKGKTERLAAPTLQVLAGKVTAGEAQAILAPMVKQIESAQDPSALKEHWAVVWAFGGMATPDQAAAVRAAAVRAFERTAEPDELQMLSHAVGALPGALTADQARRVLAPIAKQIAETKWALQALGDAVAALTPALPADDTLHVLDLVLPKLDGSDPFATKGLASAVASLAPRLSPDRARAVLTRVLWSTARAKLDFAGEPHVDAISAISERLSAEDAQVMLPSVLATLSRVPYQVTSTSIERAVNAIVARLEPPQAEKQLAQMLGPVGVADVALAYSEGVLTPAVRALAGKLSPSQKDAALARVLAICARLQPTTDADVVMPLKSISSILGGTCALSPPPTLVLEQALLTMLMLDVMNSPVDDESFQLMSEMVTRDQARRLLTPALAVLERMEDGPPPGVVAALRSWFDRGLLTAADAANVRAVALTRMATVRSENKVDEFEARRELAMLLVTLPGRLTPEQGQAALTLMLKADESTASTSDFFEWRRKTAETILALSPQLTPEQRQTAATAMGSELAWADTDASALAAANAAIALLPPERDARASAIVEMLKYPTAASGPAAGALLTALREAAKPTSPGSTDGPDATFAWIHASFPHANLDKLPACPPPRHAGLTCPATVPAR